MSPSTRVREREVKNIERAREGQSLRLLWVKKVFFRQTLAVKFLSTFSCALAFSGPLYYFRTLFLLFSHSTLSHTMSNTHRQGHTCGSRKFCYSFLLLFPISSTSIIFSSLRPMSVSREKANEKASESDSDSTYQCRVYFFHQQRAKKCAIFAMQSLRSAEEKDDLTVRV